MKRSSVLFWLAALAVVVAVQPASGQAAPAAAKTIWEGVYTDAQAARGEQAARQNCSNCHSPAEWSSAMFIPNWSGHSVGELHNQIRSTMPFDAPGRLTPAQYSDIVAYMLKINNVPAGTAELPSDDEGLNKIVVTRPQSR